MTESARFPSASPARLVPEKPVSKRRVYGGRNGLAIKPDFNSRREARPAFFYYGQK